MCNAAKYLFFYLTFINQDSTLLDMVGKIFSRNQCEHKQTFRNYHVVFSREMSQAVLDDMMAILINGQNCSTRSYHCHQHRKLIRRTKVLHKFLHHSSPVTKVKHLGKKNYKIRSQVLTNYVTNYAHIELCSVTTPNIQHTNYKTLVTDSQYCKSRVSLIQGKISLYLNNTYPWGLQQISTSWNGFFVTDKIILFFCSSLQTTTRL